MKKNHMKTLIIILAILAAFGFSSAAFGHGYWEHHGGMGWHHRDSDRSYDGSGWHHMGPRHHRYGYRYDLSEETLSKIKSQRDAYYKATESLREKLYEKEYDLDSELDKGQPDVKIVSKIQKDISKLKAELDQKHLDYLIALKKIDPKLSEAPKRKSRFYRGSCWD